MLVLEAHAVIGMETSSRNSEVIHAGLYYPEGSLKARLCVAGRDALYAYCTARSIPHRRCGKLVVATSHAQEPTLEQIAAQARANACHEVTLLSAREARALESELSCTAALHSPLTGIIDSHAYMLALQADAQAAGALFAFGSKVVGGQTTHGGIALKVSTGSEVETDIQASIVINCAGLWAPRTAMGIAGLDRADIPSAYFAKGNYFSLRGRSPFSRLIYPVPQPGGLGVHLTLDLAGQARFGPDVEWLDEEHLGYAVDASRVDAFYGAIRAYWPGLPDAALLPAYAGIRPKTHAPGAAAGDFLFASHGSPHYLGLYGIESPGLTASLAIAEYVRTLIA